MTPEEAILAAIPDTDTGHRVRIALLQLFWAAKNCEIDVALVASWIDVYLEDPPRAVWCGPWEAEHLATHLEVLAKEIRKALRVIEAAKPDWTPPEIKPEADPDGVPF